MEKPNTMMFIGGNTKDRKKERMILPFHRIPALAKLRELCMQEYQQLISVVNVAPMTARTTSQVKNHTR